MKPPLLLLLALATILQVVGIPGAAAATPSCLGEPATITGTSGADVLVGTPGPDVIVALGGHDVVQGLGGDDLICAGDGRNEVLGGDGNDRLIGGRGDDVLTGGLGDDVLIGGKGADLLDGSSGADRLLAGDGPDRLLGGANADVLRGGSGGDTLDGGAGPDDLAGGPGADTLVEVLAADTVADAGTTDAAGDARVYGSLTLEPLGGTHAVFPNDVSWRDQRHTNPIEVRHAPGGLVLEERIDPESYLLGIAEMPYSWHPAALRAQAIAARSYLANLVANPRWGVMAEFGFDICGSAVCQLYVGAGSVEAATDGPAWRAAVRSTAGQILLYEGEPALALYHSTAGRTTRSVQDVWPGSGPVPYLQAVEVPPQDSPFAEWSFTLPMDALLEILAADGVAIPGEVTGVWTIVTQPGGGPYRVRFQTDAGPVEVGADRVQAAVNAHGPGLYPDLLPAYRPDGPRYPQAVLSPTFTVRSQSNSTEALFQGQGWGHQLGMPQYGAQAMALGGTWAAGILNHFYSGLWPAADPGFLPDEITVGLGWDRSEVTLRAERYVLRSGTGVVARGLDGEFTLLAGPGGTVELAAP
jgi:SpoIID/LytB domain protein